MSLICAALVGTGSPSFCGALTLYSDYRRFTSKGYDLWSNRGHTSFGDARNYQLEGRLCQANLLTIAVFNILRVRPINPAAEVVSPSQESHTVVAFPIS